jgi:hypothetical protein
MTALVKTLGIAMLLLGSRCAYLAYVDLLPANRMTDGSAGVWAGIWGVLLIAFGGLFVLSRRLDQDAPDGAAHVRRQMRGMGLMLLLPIAAAAVLLLVAGLELLR